MPSNYNNNHVQKYRLEQKLPLAVLQAVTGYTQGFLRALEAKKFDGEIHPSVIRKMADRLGVKPEDLFPSIDFSAPMFSPEVLDLLAEQTTPESRPEQTTKLFTLRLESIREPEDNESEPEWSVPCYTYVAQRQLYLELIRDAEERGGGIRRDSTRVDRGRRHKLTLFVLPSQQAAEEFRAKFHGREYEPDPLPPRVEIIHRGAQVPTSLLLKHQPLAPRVEPEEEEEEIPSPELDLEEGNEPREVVLRLKLTPPLLAFYRGIQRHLGQGATQMIGVEGILHYAEKLGL